MAMTAGWARPLLLGAALLQLCSRAGAQAPSLDCSGGDGFNTLNGFFMTRTDSGLPHALLDVIPPASITNSQTGTTWNFPGDYAAFVSDGEVTLNAYIEDAAGTRSSDYGLGDSIPAPIGTSSLYIIATNVATGEVTTQYDCMAIVSVNDLEAPSVTCPADKTVNTDSGEPFATVTLQEFDASAVDGANYDDNSVTGDLSILAVTITNMATTGGITPGTTGFDIGTTQVRYRIAHTPQNQGNTLSAVCTFDIIVVDAEAPAITCPDAATIETDPGLNTAERTLQLSNATATDNSGVVTITNVLTSTNGISYTEVANVGAPQASVQFTLDPSVTYVRYMAVDPYGNQDACQIFYTVVDHEKPIVTCPANQDLDTGGGLGYVSVSITGSDASYTDNEEASGVSGSTLTVTAHLVSSVGTVISAGDSVASHDFAIASGGESLVHEVYFVVIDSSLNSGHCVMNVTVTDREPPVLDCPYDDTSFTTSELTDPGNETHPMGYEFATLVMLHAAVTDNSGVTLPFMATAQFGGVDEVVLNTDSGAAVVGDSVEFPIGSTTVVYSATDTQGNVGTCSVVIDVSDTEAPILACPEDITVPTDPGAPTTTITLPGPPDIRDNSGDAPTLTLTISGSTIGASYDFPIGSTTVVYTATDGAGQSTSCNLEVVILDTELPVLVCPDSSAHVTDRGVSGPPGSPFTTVALIGSDASVTDNSGETPSIVASIDGTDITTATTEFLIGVTTVVFRAVDTNSNEGNCSMTVTVEDDEAPVLSCPPNVTVTTTANSNPALSGEHLATVTLENATAVDNSETTLTVVRDRDPATDFDIGNSTVTFSAVDPYGHTGECTVSVIVLDEEDPVLSCPADVTFDLADDGTSYRDLNFASDIGIATVTDNNDLVSTPVPIATATLQGVPTTLSGTVRFHCCDDSPTIVTFTATDVDGNIGTCTVSVSVEDIQIPQLVCTEDLLSLTTDAHASGGSNVGYPYHATLVLPPEITDNSNEVLIAVAVINEAERMPLGTSTPLTIAYESVSETYQHNFYIGETNITFTATDSSGMSGTCVTKIRVLDNEDPVLVCPSSPIESVTEPGQPYSILSVAKAAVEDNSLAAITNASTGLRAYLTYSTSPVEIDENPSDASQVGPLELTIGYHTVTFTADDPSGRQSSCEIVVSVVDRESPILTCPTDVAQSTNAGVNYADVQIPTLTMPSNATDNSGDVSLTITPKFQLEGESFLRTLTMGNTEAFELDAATRSSKTYQITYSTMDASGNNGSCLFNLTITDSEDPIVTCPSDIVQNADVDSPHATVDLPALLASDVVDNSGHENAPIFYYLNTFIAINKVTGSSFTPYAFGGGGQNENLVLIVDGVEETILLSAPTWSNGASVTQAVGALNTDLGSTGWQAYVAADGENLELRSVSSIAMPWAVDISSSSGAHALALFGAVTASVAGVFETGSPPGREANAVIYTSADNSGNVGNCTLSITVNDNQAPDLSCPPDATLNTDEHQPFTSQVFGPIDDSSFGSVSDNHDSALIGLPSVVVNGSTVELVDLYSVTQDPHNFYIGVTTVTYTATDAAGNAGTCTQVVTVEDHEAPRLTCPTELNTGPGSPVPQPVARIPTDQYYHYATVTLNGAIDVTVTDNSDEISSRVLQNLVDVSAVDLHGDTVNNGVQQLPIGTVTLTYFVTDDANIRGECTVDAVVVDTEAPVLSCPHASIYDNSTDPGQDYRTVVIRGAGATVYDNNPADDTTENLALGILMPNATYVLPDLVCAVNCTGECYDGDCISVITDATTVQLPIGVTTITFRAQDSHDNMGFCSIDVTIVDSEPPVLVCPSNLDYFNSPGLSYRAVNVDDDVAFTTHPTVTDNSGANLASTVRPTIAGVGPIAADYNFSIGVTAVIFQAMDGANNTGTCGINVTVTDNEAPVLVCDPAVFVVVTDPDDSDADPIGHRFATITLAAPTVTDNSGLTLVAIPSNSSQDIAMTSQFDMGYTLVTFTADDTGGCSGSGPCGASNIGTCEVNVTVLDQELPHLVCPPSQVLGTDENQDYSTFSLGSAVVTDNSMETLSAAADTAQTQFTIGVTNVTYSAQDSSANTGVCQISVTVLDQEKPRLSCPANIETFTDEFVSFATVTIDAATVVDNSGETLAPIPRRDNGSVVSVVPPAQFDLENSTVTYFATDSAGNVGNCTFIVTVLDNQHPGVDCPPDLFLFTDAPQGSDVVGQPFATISLVAAPVEDNSGESLVAYAGIGLNISLGPNEGAGLPSELLSLPLPTFRYDGSSYENAGTGGNYNVTYAATDTDGNIGTCVLRISIVDAEIPVLTCPPPQSVRTDQFEEFATVTLQTASVIDNSGETLVAVANIQDAVGGRVNVTIGAPFQFDWRGNAPRGVEYIDVNYTAVDSSGNLGQCTITVTVQELDDCSPNPCIHGNCTDLIANFSCDCEPGWRGETCSIDINECALLNPCENRAVCEDSTSARTDGSLMGCQYSAASDCININEYRCLCEDRFTGHDCEYLDECSYNPCHVEDAFFTNIAPNNGSTVDPSRFFCAAADIVSSFEGVSFDRFLCVDPDMTTTGDFYCRCPTCDETIFTNETAQILTGYLDTHQSMQLYIKGEIRKQRTTGGACVDPAVPYSGCTDPLAQNYDPLANDDDGSCLARVNGCTNPAASNYDPTATEDDGTVCTVESAPTNECLSDPCQDVYYFARGSRAGNPLGVCEETWVCSDPNLYVLRDYACTCPQAVCGTEYLYSEVSNFDLSIFLHQESTLKAHLLSQINITDQGR